MERDSNNQKANKNQNQNINRNQNMPKRRKIIKKSSLKKRKQAQIRIFIILGIILIVLGYAFLPMFRINSFVITNQKYSDRNKLEVAGNEVIGSHINLFSKKDFNKIKETDPYVADIKLKVSPGTPLEIDVKERKRDFLLNFEGNLFYLDRTGKVLSLSNEEDNYTVLLKDDTVPTNPGTTMYMDGDKKSFLTEFKNLMDINTSTVGFHTVDITDTGDIKIYSGKWEIQIGSGTKLKDKLNNAVNILKTLNPKEEGQIDVRFESAPVIRKKKRMWENGYWKKS